MTCISVINVRIRHLGSFHQDTSPISHFKFEIWKEKRHYKSNDILVTPRVIIVSNAPTPKDRVNSCLRSLLKSPYHLWLWLGHVFGCVSHSKELGVYSISSISNRRFCSMIPNMWHVSHSMCLCISLYKFCA